MKNSHIRFGEKLHVPFCGLNKHNVSRCWKKIAMHRKLLKQRRKEAKYKENHVEKKMQLFFTHCYKQGHIVDKCYNLYPKSHPRHVKKLERHLEKNGKEDSIINVGQDDSHDDVQLKEAPLKWFGKRWLYFLTN